MTDIELYPGTPFCSTHKLNRIARQQGLCLAIAQASVFDEICVNVPLPASLEKELIQSFRCRESIESDDSLNDFLKRKGWNLDDLIYFSTKQERLIRFSKCMFSHEVEQRFLANKFDRDQIHYSLIRLSDGDLAFELHQQLQEGEASFEDLASNHSEGPERSNSGRIGPVSLSQPHPAVVEKLRVGNPGQLWPPFFLVDIWLILRLDSWEGARLDETTRSELIEELFQVWIHERVLTILSGQIPSPIPEKLFLNDNI